MTDKDPYKILGIAADAKEEDIIRAYRDSVAECFKKNGQPEELFDISNAYIALLNFRRRLTIPDIGRERRVLVQNPGWDALWQKSLSPGLVLGVMVTVLAGGLIGYSLKPTETVTREIIREAQVANATPAPVQSLGKEGPKEQPYTSQLATEKSPSKVAIAMNPTPPTQKTTTLISPNAKTTAISKGIPISTNSTQHSKIFPVLPPPLPMIGQHARGTIQRITALSPVPQSPILVPKVPSSTRPFASAQSPDQLPSQKIEPNNNIPIGPLTTEEESDSLISKVHLNKTSQQATSDEPRKESNPTATSTPTVVKPSPQKVLETIQIPMGDGTSVPASKLLHLNTEAWQLEKGRIRSKLNTLISELVESQDLNSACGKSDISIEGLQLLIKKYGNS